MRTITSRGLCFFNSSQPRPQPSNVPGWKFSTSTSARSTSFFSSAAPSAFLKLIVSDFLLRPSDSHTSESPQGVGVPNLRVGSPTPGISTLTTSAPNSAKKVAQYGPAMKVAQSSTRMPLSAPGPGGVAPCGCGSVMWFHSP